MKFKANQPVVATASRNGVKTEGRFAGLRESANGRKWIDVNISPKGKPAVLKSYSPAQVVPA